MESTSALPASTAPRAPAASTPAPALATLPSFWRMQALGWLVYWAAMATSRVGRFPASYMVVSKGLLALFGFAITALLLRPVYQRMLRGDPALPRIILVTAMCAYAAA